MFKKIIPLILASSIVFSCIVPASAADAPTTGEVVNDIVQVSMAEVIFDLAVTAGTTAVGAYFGQPQVGAYLGPFIANGILNYADFLAAGYTDQDIYDQFTNYNAQLETDLGTTTLIDGGIRKYFVATGIRNSTSSFSSSSLGVLSSGVWNATGKYGCTVGFNYGEFDAPFACNYRRGHFIETDCPVGADTTPNSTDLTYVNAGARIQGLYISWTVSDADVRGVSYNISGARWADLYPVSGYLPTGADITSNSRPTTLTTPVAVRNDDNTYTVYNQTIVNETDNTVFNPVTNITTVFTDWAFDYSTRTYTLILEDGSTVTVIYGDDCITIIQGDQEYTVYYVIPSEEDPGGSGGSGDSGDSDSSAGWSWLVQAWTGLMEKLTQILEAITGLDLSQEINVDVDVDVNGGESETQESWFSKLLTKFSFVSSVHDIYSQLVADVTSDAETAYLLSEGSITEDEVTTQHAAVYALDDGEDTVSYTAPELAISFGSSDKYGVDWESIKPLDLSWYAPYKPTVDNIVSGILWLTYVFLLIKRLPGIIHGAEMVTEDCIKIDDFRWYNGL